MVYQDATIKNVGVILCQFQNFPKGHFDLKM